VDKKNHWRLVGELLGQSEERARADDSLDALDAIDKSLREMRLMAFDLIGDLLLESVSAAQDAPEALHHAKREAMARAKFHAPLEQENGSHPAGSEEWSVGDGLVPVQSLGGE
jgi:hypothetical protein